jgi:NAD(P)-dependent dehydrogenase (short-subunit alcohol dehydrogenase family)
MSGIHEAPVLVTGASSGIGRKITDVVAEAVVHALFDPNPKRRWLATPNVEEAEMTIRAALARLAELNAGHPYSYSESELIGLVKEAMAAP